MIKNILKVPENQSWAKKIMGFFIKGTLFKNLCNNCVNDQQKPFEETTALKCMSFRIV